MKNSVAIVDFGSSKITTLIGEMSVNKTLNILGKGEISYAGFQNSEFLEPEKLKDLVKSSIFRAESVNNIKISEVYVGVPGEFTAVVPKTVTFTFPRSKKITWFDINSIFRTGNTFEKETNYSLINKSVIYYELDDSQKVMDPIELKSKTLIGNISYVLALKTFVSTIKNVFSNLKIAIRGFISSILSESLYLFDDEKRNNYSILLDIGYISTSIAVSQGNGLVFLNSFSLGGAYLSSDLAQCLRIPFVEAEILKDKIAIAWQPTQEDNYIINFNGVIKNYSAKATNEIVFDRIESICDCAINCLESVEFELPKNSTIYLSGGGVTKIKGIRNVLSQKFRRPVQTIDLANNHKVKPNCASSESLLYFVIKNYEKLDKILIKV